MKLLIFFSLRLWLILFIITFLTQKVMGQSCDKSFSDAVAESVKWEVFKKIKNELVYLPRAKEQIANRIKLALAGVFEEDFSRKTAQLSARKPTTVLFFDNNQQCIWLFNSRGQFISGSMTNWNAFELNRVLVRLGVTGSDLPEVRSRKSKRNCLTSTSGNYPNSEMGDIDYKFRLLRVRKALERLRKSLFPDNIFKELLESTDERIIIVPSNGIGLVPFSALPIDDEQYFIDKFSIVIAPGISSILGIKSINVNEKSVELFANQVRDEFVQARYRSSGEFDRTYAKIKYLYEILPSLKPILSSYENEIIEEIIEYIDSANLVYLNYRDIDSIDTMLVRVISAAKHLLTHSKNSPDNDFALSQIMNMRFLIREMKLRQAHWDRSLLLFGREAEVVELRRSENDKRIDTTIIVGDPDLSSDKEFCWKKLNFASKEARAVSTKFKNSLLFEGKSATFEKVTQALKRNQSSARYIYFATHGLSDAVNPADGSFLALKSKNLTGAWLRNLSLKNNPLVVLSACQTGLGKVFPGGLFGLAQAWHYAGAEKIVMSLWNVSDKETADLMIHFNAFLSQNDPSNLDVAHAEFALAQAMREFKRIVPDPAYWAGMTVYGSPAP